MPGNTGHGYSGDGKSDILLQHSSGALAMWLMDGTSIASGPMVGAVSVAQHRRGRAGVADGRRQYNERDDGWRLADRLEYPGLSAPNTLNGRTTGSDGMDVCFP